MKRNTMKNWINEIMNQLSESSDTLYELSKLWEEEEKEYKTHGVKNNEQKENE